MIPIALLDNLPRRAAMMRTIRQWFDDEGFVEVETPVRIPAPANEPHIQPPPSGSAFLRASPELQMKRLLASGFQKIYQIGPCFRAGERGGRHAPEFTMLEWYRANAQYTELLADMESFVAKACVAVCGDPVAVYGGYQVALDVPWERITVREAYRRWAHWDPVRDFDAARFDMDMALVIEPALPKDKAVFLMDYPREAASLARLKGGMEPVAERWEAYIGGMELANAFGELTDPQEQRRRFALARQEKIAAGEEPMPMDEDFLEELGVMPSPSSGAALGIDRLCMVLTGATSIDEVRAFLPPTGALW